MRWEEKAALRMAAAIEAQQEADRRRAEARKVRAMRETFLDAVIVARDGGLSATELSDAWSIDRPLIIEETDRVHTARRYAP